MRSLVLDDVGAAPAPSANTAEPALPPSETLAGRDRLDERVETWLRERERFAKRGTASSPREDPPAGSAGP